MTEGPTPVKPMRTAPQDGEPTLMRWKHDLVVRADRYMTNVVMAASVLDDRTLLAKGFRADLRRCADASLAVLALHRPSGTVARPTCKVCRDERGRPVRFPCITACALARAAIEPAPSAALSDGEQS